MQALRGTTHWKYLIGKNEWHEVNIECELPMMRKDELPCMEFSVSEEENVVTLEFDREPIDIFVIRYDEDAWGDRMAEYDDIYVKGNTFVLSDENSIYEVSARWYTNEGNKLQGTVCYNFYTKKV